MEKIILLDALARNLSIFSQKTASELGALSATTLAIAASNGAYEAELEDAVKNYVEVVRFWVGTGEFKDTATKLLADRYLRILYGWIDDNELKLSREHASVLIVNLLRY